MLKKLRNAKKVGPYLSSVLLSAILVGMIRFQNKYDPPYDQDSDIIVVVLVSTAL